MSSPIQAGRTAELLAALEKAVEVIKQWHNMDGSSEVWQIYYENAPEMKPIRDALILRKPTERDAIAAQRDGLAAQNRKLVEALEALTVWSRNGEQLCFRSHNGVPMGMSKKQEKLARAALSAEQS